MADRRSLLKISIIYYFSWLTHKKIKHLVKSQLPSFWTKSIENLSYWNSYPGTPTDKVQLRKRLVECLVFTQTVCLQGELFETLAVLVRQIFLSPPPCPLSLFAHTHIESKQLSLCCSCMCNVYQHNNSRASAPKLTSSLSLAKPQPVM